MTTVKVMGTEPLWHTRPYSKFSVCEPHTILPGTGGRGGVGMSLPWVTEQM